MYTSTVEELEEAAQICQNLEQKVTKKVRDIFKRFKMV